MSKQVIIVERSQESLGRLFSHIDESALVVASDFFGPEVDIKPGSIVLVQGVKGLTEDSVKRFVEHMPQSFLNAIDLVYSSYSPDESDVDLFNDYENALQDLWDSFAGLPVFYPLTDENTGIVEVCLPPVDSGIYWFSPSEQQFYVLFNGYDDRRFQLAIGVEALVEGAAPGRGSGIYNVSPDAETIIQYYENTGLFVMLASDDQYLLGVDFCSDTVLYPEDMVNDLIVWPDPYGGFKTDVPYKHMRLQTFENSELLIMVSYTEDDGFTIEDEDCGMFVLTEAEAREAFPDYPWPAPEAKGLVATKKNSIRIR